MDIMPKRTPSRQQGSGRYMQLGLQIALSFLVFVGLGFWIDGKWGSRPWGILGGAFFGMISMVSLLYKVFLQLEQQDRKRFRSGSAKDV